MNFIVLDSETDGLAYECTKLHVLSWTEDGTKYNSTNNPRVMHDLFSRPNTKFVAHNAVRFDLVVFNRLLGTDLNYKHFVDTLALSWYLFPDRNKHGLEEWGVDLGVPKPKITDWENLSYEEYKHRCEEDVKINWLLWQKCLTKLEEIYD